jgi:hypothetical protein
MRIELWVSVWGAVTGTFGAAYGLRQLYLDRAKLKVEAKITVQYTHRINVVLTASVVNVGRRSVRIKEVSAYLTKSALPIPIGLSPEKADEMRRAREAGHSESLLCLFGSRGESAFELKPDGGEHNFSKEIPEGCRFLSDTEFGEKHGRGYILLTSRKKLPFRFLLLPDDKWP